MSSLPTTNLDQARTQLDQLGYCILADALSLSQTQALRERLITQAEHEKSIGTAFEDGGPDQQWGAFIDAQGRIRENAFKEENGGINQRVWMLVNKGQVFIDLLQHETIKSLVHHVLGDEFLLSSHTANIAKPGGVEMPLHTDQWWMPAPTLKQQPGLPVGSITRNRFDEMAAAQAEQSSHIAVAACSNVIWMLDDFTVDNGATRLVPGSHLSGRHPDPELDRDVQTVSACAPAGSALITDGRVWHGTGANTGDSNRNAVLTTFCGPQFRPQENFVAGTRREVVDAASEETLALLGFKVWWGYGRTGNPTTYMIDRDETPIGILGEDAKSGTVINACRSVINGGFTNSDVATSYDSSPTAL